MPRVGECCPKPVITNFSGRGEPGTAWGFTHRYCAHCGAHEYGREEVLFYNRSEWEAWVNEARTSIPTTSQ